jgi:putative adenylate-forming enzyme
LFADQDIANWRSFPTTDKQAMMANFGRYNTLGIGKEEALAVARTAEQTRDFKPTIRGATVGLSSGTSGNFSLFLSSNQESCWFVGTALARLLRRSIFSKQRIAFFHRAHSNLYNSLQSGRIQYQFFDLTNELEQQFEKLETFAPTLIIGPPFVLSQLGKAKRDSTISIVPRNLLSVAEVLDDSTAAQIKSDFGIPLDEAYICTEGFIAATCQHGSLHVNEDLLVMQKEWLDESQRRFVPIITDFRRRVQPMIRYRLDDVLVDSQANCECGSQFAVLERIEGRCDDVLVLRKNNSDELRRIFPDFVRRTMAFACEKTKQYRVIQEGIDCLTIELEIESGSRQQEQRRIERSLLELCSRFECAPPKFNFAELGPQDHRFKVRRVQRNFETDLT